MLKLSVVNLGRIEPDSQTQTLKSELGCLGMIYCVARAN